MSHARHPASFMVDTSAGRAGHRDVKRIRGRGAHSERVYAVEGYFVESTDGSGRGQEFLRDPRPPGTSVLDY